MITRYLTPLLLAVTALLLSLASLPAWADGGDDATCAREYPGSQYSETYHTCVCSELIPDCLSDSGSTADTGTLPRAPMREFRAMWVATYKNIDWPSRPGLSILDQKKELIGILDRAKAYGFNAVVLQVRPIGDALYTSSLAPYSPYLTGKMGKSPGYDPLAFAVAAAHARGLELHAWLNPFRVGLTSSDFTALGTDAKEASVAHPEFTKTYGKYLWLDPSDDRAQAYVIAVVNEILRKYDVDGIHFDDYFYPYRESDNSGVIDFPDAENYAKYLINGGTLAKSDWRRDRVNTFVKRVYTAIKSRKRYVKFGISPFGIWRPGNPENVTGMDAYDVLFADSRTWLQKGWVDYLAPQLYWSIDSSGQSYPSLLDWWNAQNPKKRYIFP